MWRGNVQHCDDKRNRSNIDYNRNNFKMRWRERVQNNRGWKGIDTSEHDSGRSVFMKDRVARREDFIIKDTVV